MISALKKLSKNKWIKNITSKGITYTDEFKYKLVKECENYKKFPLVYLPLPLTTYRDADGRSNRTYSVAQDKRCY